ncbi:MAG: patatin-like phospholipase family protein [Cyclobacteriaceae bacterium]
MLNGKQKIGIALSGGGARGITHLGVLHELDKAGFSPSIVSGTSFGAIVGVFYAAGFTPLEILDFVKRTRFRSLIKNLLSQHGLLSLEYLRGLMINYIKVDNFNVLKIPFHVSVTNLNSGKNEIISSGRLFDYVLASASLPIIFKPIVIHDDMYVDGGLLNNMPTDPLRNTCDIIIGVHVNYYEKRNKIEGIRDLADRVFRMAVWQNVENRVDDCHIYIEPKEMKQYNTFAFERADEFFEIGKEAALKILPKLEALVLDKKTEEAPYKRTVKYLKRIFN